MNEFQQAVIDATSGYLDTNTEALPADLDRSELRKVRRLFTGDPGPLKRKRIASIKKRVVAYLGSEPKDWSAADIPWAQILKFIIAILPLIMALFA